MSDTSSLNTNMRQFVQIADAPLSDDVYLSGHLTGTGQAPSGAQDQGFAEPAGLRLSHNAGPVQWEQPADQLGNDRSVTTLRFPTSPFTPLPSDPSTSQGDPFYPQDFDPLPSQSDPFIGTPSQPSEYFPMMSQEHEMSYGAPSTPSPLGPYAGYQPNGMMDSVYAVQLLQQFVSERERAVQSGPDSTPTPRAEAFSQGEPSTVQCISAPSKNPAEPAVRNQKGKKRERSGSAIASSEKAGKCFDPRYMLSEAHSHLI